MCRDGRVRFVGESERKSAGLDPGIFDSAGAAFGDRLSKLACGWHTSLMSVRIVFYGSLRDFLPRGKGSEPFVLPITHHSQLKDMIESCGVPHCEVDLVTVNGVSAPFTRRLKGGEEIFVYPAGALPADAPESLVRPPAPETRFVVDCNLGKLKTGLRRLGFDCFYENHSRDSLLADVAFREKRILLSKDVTLLMRSKVVYGYWVRATDPLEQVLEVVRRYSLWPKVRLYSRCIVCNGEIREVPKEEVQELVEPLTRKYYEHFYQCSACGKIYWRGSHSRQIEKWHKVLERAL